MIYHHADGDYNNDSYFNLKLYIFTLGYCKYVYEGRGWILTSVDLGMKINTSRPCLSANLAMK